MLEILAESGLLKTNAHGLVIRINRRKTQGRSYPAKAKARSAHKLKERMIHLKFLGFSEKVDWDVVACRFDFPAKSLDT